MIDTSTQRPSHLFCNMLVNTSVAILSLFAAMGAAQIGCPPPRKRSETAPGAPFIRSAPHARRDMCFYGKGVCCDDAVGRLI